MNQYEIGMMVERSSETLRRAYEHGYISVHAYGVALYGLYQWASPLLLAAEEAARQINVGF